MLSQESPGEEEQPLVDDNLTDTDENVMPVRAQRKRYRVGGGLGHGPLFKESNMLMVAVVLIVAF